MGPEVPVAPMKVGSLVGLGSGVVERLGLCPQKLGSREVGAQRGCKDAEGVAEQAARRQERQIKE